MPCDYKQYPKNWKRIVAHLKNTRGDRCELCFAPNGAQVWRDFSPQIMHPWYPKYLIPKECMDRHEGRFTKIIITTHHIDSDKKNNHPHNLILLCQRCHLKLDMQKHMRRRKERKV